MFESRQSPIIGIVSSQCKKTFQIIAPGNQALVWDLNSNMFWMLPAFQRALFVFEHDWGGLDYVDSQINAESRVM